MQDTFSQYAEDLQVWEVVKDIPNGRVLDIGAWNYETFSNSRKLILAGWEAVLIEPSPGPLRDLAREYHRNLRVRVVGAAVTVQGGLVDLAITDDAVSQPHASDRIQGWLDSGGFFGRVTFPALSMEQVFNSFGGDFELVSIDTEGESVDLFAEMIRIGPRPRCVIVEHDNRIVELNQYAEAANYRQLTINGTNWIGVWQGKREW